jgi:hypothetical protein
MSSGMEMLLKQLGIDPQKISSDFTALKDGVQKTLTKIDERLGQMQEAQARIEASQQLNTKLLEEITAWKRIQQYQSNQPQQQPTQQRQQQPQLVEHS